ncbi:hypothetical protein QJQ45_007942 [Haematococcus lacustris]|nr:hypothetical protein QJQ45_007942 [Haematococcus lacustris]
MLSQRRWHTRFFRSSLPALGTPRGRCAGQQVPEAKCQKPRAAPEAFCRASPLQDTLDTSTALTSRRRMLLISAAALAMLPLPGQAAMTDVPAAEVQLDLAPDQAKYDPDDMELRAAAQLLQEGLAAPDVVREEAVWTQIIDTYGGLQRPWVPDVVGRAWGNRGNARSRQGKLAEALVDYNTSIALCPYSPDPVLNRGVVLEALGRFPEAVADYQAVLRATPADPAAWNNLGNASAGMGQWQEALAYYSKAVELAPGFSFASANRALALYQLGQAEQAIREMRNLLRRYSSFTDMRAALAAALWGAGLEGQAEIQWERVDDARYRDRDWLKSERRWPPSLVANLEAFLDLKSVNGQLPHIESDNRLK